MAIWICEECGKTCTGTSKKAMKSRHKCMEVIIVPGLRRNRIRQRVSGLVHVIKGVEEDGK